MTTPNIKRMTPIVASHLSFIKYNPKIAINKPKNITIIDNPGVDPDEHYRLLCGCVLNTFFLCHNSKFTWSGCTSYR